MSKVIESRHFKEDRNEASDLRGARRARAPFRKKAELCGNKF
jgi:hypothetical protein